MTILVQVIFVYCPAWIVFQNRSLSFIISCNISSLNLNLYTLYNYHAHKSNNPEAKHKKVVMKGAIGEGVFYTSYLLHPPVLHLLLDYSRLSVSNERESKREAFGTRVIQKHKHYIKQASQQLV